MQVSYSDCPDFRHPPPHTHLFFSKKNNQTTCSVSISQMMTYSRAHRVKRKYLQTFPFSLLLLQAVTHKGTFNSGNMTLKNKKPSWRNSGNNNSRNLKISLQTSLNKNSSQHPLTQSFPSGWLSSSPRGDTSQYQYFINKWKTGWRLTSGCPWRRQSIDGW